MKSNCGNLKSFTDERGGFLIPLNFDNLDFTPKRIFTITDVPKDTIRGQHAHHKTKQFLLCIKGKILVSLDNGKEIINKIINAGEYIYINNYVWDYQQFLTGDDVLVVLASTNYDQHDYINSKEEFYKIVKS